MKMLTEEDFIRAISDGPGPLAHLSIQKVKRGGTPARFTNEDRRREYNAIKPSAALDSNFVYPWPHLERTHGK